ncbi:DUF2188 domain-containing protein [Nocardioides pakistanensis]
MPQGDIETFHQDDQWWNRVEGQDAKTGPYATKDEAVSEGRDLARQKKVEHIIRNLDGQIGERNSYGNDPRDIPG